MKARLLLAGAAIVAGAAGAHAEVTAMGGAAIFTLPPLPGLAYTFVSTNGTGYDYGQRIDAQAFGIVPVFGFAIEAPGAARIGGFAEAFHAAGTSGFTGGPIGNGHSSVALALFSIYPGVGSVTTDVFYGDNVGPQPGNASAGALLDLHGFDGFAFALAATTEGTDFGICVGTGEGNDPDPDCKADASVVNNDDIGPAFAYIAAMTDEGILVATAGVLPDGALTLSETAGFRYFGGQDGMTVALDLGAGQATAKIGGIFRSLSQSHQTRLDVDFDVPVDGGTLSAQQTIVGDESLIARYFGSFFGVSLENNSTARLVATLDLGVAPMLMVANYTGQQSATLDVTAPGTDVHFATDLPAVALRDIRPAVLVNVGGQVGLRFGRAAKLTVGGFVEYLSAAPTVIHDGVDGRPTLTPPFRGFADGDGAAAVGQNIMPPGQNPVVFGTQPMFTYGASVTLSIGLGAR